MRAAVTTISIAAAIAAVSPALAGVSVRIDEGAPVRISGQAAQVAVGNPAIADVQILDRHKIMLLGRGYGSTNVIVFDPTGRAIFDTVVTVGSPGVNHISVYRGPLVTNFTCGGHCERTPMPGEVQEQYQPFATPYKDYSDRAKTAAGGGSQ